MILRRHYGLSKQLGEQQIAMLLRAGADAGEVIKDLDDAEQSRKLGLHAFLD